MKIPILILVIFGTVTVVSAQSLDWVKQFEGTGNVFSRSMAVDNAGNIFTTGSFDDTLFVDTDTAYYPIISQGNKDIYLSKRSPTGELLWLRDFGATGNDAGLSVATDSVGNVYISGYFSDTLDFDPGVDSTHLISQKGYYGVFVGKYDPLGNLLWAKQLGDGEIYFVTSMSASKDGTVYLFGTFSDTLDLDPGPSVASLYSSKRDNMFVAKYSASGRFKWAINIESSGGNEATGIHLDEVENIFIAGSFSDTTDFDPGAGKHELVPYSYREDVFIAKLDSTGNFLWASQFGGPEDAIARDLTVDENGNVYSTGSFAGKVDFDPGPDSSFLETDSIKNTDAFISKLNSAGEFVWANRIGSYPYLEEGYSLVADGFGNIYTTGVFNRTSDLQPGSDSIYISAGILGWEDIYLNKLDPQGNYLYTKQIGGNGKDFTADITMDRYNHIYLTGHFHDQLDFDMSRSGYNLLCVDAWDGFVAKLDPSGIGITETPMGAGVFPYPNPFEDLLTIDLGHDYGKIEVTIRDAYGRLVLTQDRFNERVIRLHLNVSSGIYFVTIKPNANRPYLFKVIRSGSEATGNH